MAKYAIYIEFVFSLQSLELLTPTHPQFRTKIWLPLGSQLPVVRVRLGEDHLGCFQPSQLGRSSHLACSLPLLARHLESWDVNDQAAFPYLGVGWYYPVPVCSDVVFLAFETIFLFSLLPKMDVIDSYYNLRYFDACDIELTGGSPGFLIIWIFFTFLEYLRTFVLS